MPPDAVGNVRYLVSSYRGLDDQGAVAGSASTQGYWYSYDACNRFVVTKGVLSGGTVQRGTTGTLVSWNLDGTRASALYTATLKGIQWQYYKGGVYYGSDVGGGSWVWASFAFTGDRREDYSYTADGQLAETWRADTTTDPGDMPELQNAPAPTYIDPAATGELAATASYDALGR